MLSQITDAILRRRRNGSPTIDQSVREAASNQLGKQSKIETAVEAIFAHDLREVAQADRDGVAAYKAATVPGVSALKPKGTKMGGDFIVCDDYRKGTGTIPSLVMGLVAASAIGGLVTALAMRPDPPVPSETQAPAATDTDTQYILELVPD